jgi:hypothetical protein
MISAGPETNMRNSKKKLRMEAAVRLTLRTLGGGEAA